MIKVGRADFIRICRVEKVNDWMPYLEIRNDGVYVVPPANNFPLFPEESATLNEHPEKDLTKPVLNFPCSLDELQTFLEYVGAYGCIDAFDMAKFVEKELTSPKYPESEITYLDFPEALQVACDVYQEFWHDKPDDMNPARSELVEKYIRERLNRSTSDQEVKSIMGLARPNEAKRGGAPSTERETYKGKSWKNTTRKKTRP